MQTTGFPELAKFFTVGSLVQCSILELEGSKPKQKKVKLSLDPKDVNSGLNKSSLKQGMVGRIFLINQKFILMCHLEMFLQSLALFGMSTKIFGRLGYGRECSGTPRIKKSLTQKKLAGVLVQ